VSSFEFVLVSLAIVVGFGISEILAGWGRQLRHRRAVRPYPLQVVASAFLLALSLRYLWTLWSLRTAEWTYRGFVLVALPALVLALAAHLIRSDVEDPRRTPREQYFEIARPFFGLLSVFPIFGAANALYNAAHLQSAYGTATGAFRLVWPMTLGASLWLAVSRSPRHHAIGLAILWAGNVIVSIWILPALGAGP